MTILRIRNSIGLENSLLRPTSTVLLQTVALKIIQKKGTTLVRRMWEADISLRNLISIWFRDRPPQKMASIPSFSEVKVSEKSLEEILTFESTTNQTLGLSNMNGGLKTTLL